MSSFEPATQEGSVGLWDNRDWAFFGFLSVQHFAMQKGFIDQSHVRFLCQAHVREKWVQSTESNRAVRDQNTGGAQSFTTAAVARLHIRSGQYAGD